MKKKSTLWTEMSKMLVSCLLIPLYFIKYFHETAILPGRDENGTEITSRFDYHYSIYDKLAKQNYLFLFWIAFVILFLSILVSVLCIFQKQKKKLTIFSHIIFGVSVFFFVILFILAASIQYKY